MGAILSVRRAAIASAVAFAIVAGASAAAAQDADSRATAAAIGPADAPYVVTVYSDFGCEPCGRLAVVLQGLIASAPQKIRVVFKHAPSAGSRARAAHLAAAAAAMQGRFWEMHNVLFANQDRLSDEDVRGMAGQIGLDMSPFLAALASPGVAATVDADAAEAGRLGVTGRPYILINGAPFAAPLTLEDLTRATGGR